jgi:acetyl-CoA acetyltransferase
LVYTGRVGILTKLTSLRLRNNGAGQYAGASPQIDISYNGLGQAALVQVFNDLPTITAKTINITGCSGAAALTAGERAIATGKGWTIIG